METALQLIQYVEKDTFDDSSAGEMHCKMLLILNMIKRTVLIVGLLEFSDS